MKILLVCLLLLLTGCYYYYPPSVDFQFLGDRYWFGIASWEYGSPYTPYYLYYPQWYYQYEPEQPYFYYRPYYRLY